jgi:hypothetical protein
LNWEKELIIVSMILLVMLAVLLLTTYKNCGKDMLECVISFLT